MALYDVVKQFFDEDEWPYDADEENSRLHTGFSTSDGQSWRCRAIADEERYVVLFFSQAPSNAPYESRLAMAEFLTRANYGLRLGNFEMDINDGEVRYRTSVDMQDAVLTTAVVRNLVYANVLTMKRYLPGIEAVMQGSMTAVEAVAMCEAES